jgi:hypothetical protein
MQNMSFIHRFKDDEEEESQIIVTMKDLHGRGG